VAAVALVASGSWVLIARSRSGSSANAPAALAGMATYSGLARDQVAGPVLYPQTPRLAESTQRSSRTVACVTGRSPTRTRFTPLSATPYGSPTVRAWPPSEISAIAADVSGQPYGLVSPYPGLPSAIVATVWGKQPALSSAGDPRLKGFITMFRSGTQAPEPGGRCTGGTGTPLP
jgi:hypothetical protein